MINSISGFAQMPYGGILKGRDFTVGLKTTPVDDFCKEIFESVEGCSGGLNFNIKRMKNDDILLETQNSSVYINGDGRVATCITTTKNDEVVTLKPIDYQA